MCSPGFHLSCMLTMFLYIISSKAGRYIYPLKMLIARKMCVVAIHLEKNYHGCFSTFIIMYLQQKLIPSYQSINAVVSSNLMTGNMSNMMLHFRSTLPCKVHFIKCSAQDSNLQIGKTTTSIGNQYSDLWIFACI